MFNQIIVNWNKHFLEESSIASGKNEIFWSNTHIHPNPSMDWFISLPLFLVIVFILALAKWFPNWPPDGHNLYFRKMDFYFPLALQPATNVRHVNLHRSIFRAFYLCGGRFCGIFDYRGVCCVPSLTLFDVIANRTFFHIFAKRQWSGNEFDFMPLCEMQLKYASLVKSEKI